MKARLIVLIFVYFAAVYSTVVEIRQINNPRRRRYVPACLMIPLFLVGNVYRHLDTYKKVFPLFNFKSSKE